MHALLHSPDCPALRPFVETIWYFEAELPHARERILPSGSMQLLVNLHEDELRTYEGTGFERVRRIHGAAVSGAYALPFGIDTLEQRRIVGVVFRPGGAAPFFRAPPSALAGEHVELDRVWGRDGAVLRERLLEAGSPAAMVRAMEACLLERVVRPLEVDKRIELAVCALDRGAPVGEVAERLGLTPRSLLRHFERAVGMTPKRYARVRRFGRVLEAVEAGRPVDWSRVALACGYYDQAHLIHDFHEFAGMRPSHYRPRPDGDGHHAIVG